MTSIKPVGIATESPAGSRLSKQASSKKFGALYKPGELDAAAVNASNSALDNALGSALDYRTLVPPP